MCINKKETLLNCLLWQQISIKPNKILDHWKALWKYFHMVSIWYFYLILFGNGISLNKNFCFFFFHNPYIKSAFQQNRASLWKALAPKPFEIQTWDLSRLQDFFKIIENVFSKKSVLSVLSTKRKVHLFFLYAWYTHWPAFLYML